jgi:ribonuclease D
MRTCMRRALNLHTDENLRSLSGACAAFLGQPLHKTVQMSDWDRQALTDAQVCYASLDAHATLALLDVMLRLHLSLGPDAPHLGGAARFYPLAKTATRPR